MKIRLVLEIKNVTSFIKTRFYWKWGCAKMRNHAETFYTNKGYKFAIVFLIPTSSVFKIESCGVFPMLFGLKRGLLHPTFYKKMNHFLIVFHMTWDKWQRFNALRSGFWNGSVFRESAFSQVQSLLPGPVFRQCLFNTAKSMT